MTMPVQLKDSKNFSLEIMLSRDKVRLRNPITREFLHLSGRANTKDISQAWLGFQHQAETLRQRAAEQGDEWPYVIIHRAILEPVRKAHVE